MGKATGAASAAVKRNGRAGESLTGSFDAMAMPGSLVKPSISERRCIQLVVRRRRYPRPVYHRNLVADIGRTTSEFCLVGRIDIRPNSLAIEFMEAGVSGAFPCQRNFQLTVRQVFGVHANLVRAVFAGPEGNLERTIRRQRPGAHLTSPQRLSLGGECFLLGRGGRATAHTKQDESCCRVCAQVGENRV